MGEACVHGIHILGERIIADQCICLHTCKLNTDVTEYSILHKHKLGNGIPLWKVWCGKGAPLICPLQDLVCCDWIPPVSPVSMTWYLIHEIYLHERETCTCTSKSNQRYTAGVAIL